VRYARSSPATTSPLRDNHPDGKIGGTAWIFSQTFTGLATSNLGGVGFLEQTIPDD
jgi:hypothetical protein